MGKRKEQRKRQPILLVNISSNKFSSQSPRGKDTNGRVQVGERLRDDGKDTGLLSSLPPIGKAPIDRNANGFMPPRQQREETRCKAQAVTVACSPESMQKMKPSSGAGCPSLVERGHRLLPRLVQSLRLPLEVVYAQASLIRSRYLLLAPTMAAHRMNQNDSRSSFT